MANLLRKLSAPKPAQAEELAVPLTKEQKRERKQQEREEKQLRQQEEGQARIRQREQEERKRLQIREQRRQEKLKVLAQRKRLPFRAGLVGFLIMLLAVTLCATVVYFDLFNTRQLLVTALMEGDSPYNPQIERLEGLYASIAQQSLELEADRADVEARELAIEKAEKALASRENSINAKEAQLEQAAQGAELTEENIAQLVAMYEKMDAARAGTIMEEMYDVEDIAKLLGRMKQDKASGILAAIDPARAARVTELMLQ